MSSNLDLLDVVDIIQNAQNIKNIQELTATLNNLRQALSGLNPEMKMFNENITKSNEFLGRIAKLQESMEEQTRSANRFTWVVVGLGALQVAIAAFPYVAKYWLHWQI
ncbi:MAG: hypothetical protein WCE94_08470 [Candidatus Methanoperedens sp.]